MAQTVELEIGDTENHLQALRELRDTCPDAWRTVNGWMSNVLRIEDCDGFELGMSDGAIYLRIYRTVGVLRVYKYGCKKVPAGAFFADMKVGDKASLYQEIVETLKAQCSA